MFERASQTIENRLYFIQQNLTHSKSQQRQLVEKESWVRSSVDLGKTHRELGGNWLFCLGTRTLAAAVYKSLFNHVDTSTNKHHLNPNLAYYCRGLTTISRLALSYGFWPELCHKDLVPLL